MKSPKQILLVTLCALVIAASGLAIYRTQFARPKFNVELHEAIGQVMADETARLLGQKGQLVLLYAELAGQPELKTQLDEFERALLRHPSLRVEKRYPVETEGKAKYSHGSGLSGRRYVRTVNKNLDADGIVSFIGAPDLSDDELKELKKKPRFLAEVRSAEKARRPLEQGVLHVGVVGRFQHPAPVKGTPRTRLEWFTQRYQIVTTNDAAILPVNKDE